MRHDEIEVRVERGGDTSRSGSTMPGSDASLGELFKRLTTDTGDLIRQEATLVKAEVREAGAMLAADGAKIGVAAGLALAGVLALTTFLILGLGNLLDGAYWLSALLVGLLALGVGAMLAKNAVSDIKQRGVKPEQTIATLREDKAWASQQARELKRDLTTDPTASPTKR